MTAGVYTKPALELLAMGLSVIPIRHGNAKKNWKKPAITSWRPFQDARATPDQVRDWFAATVDGLAIILGDVSGGLCCRDFDDAESYERWARAFPGPAKALPTVQTNRGRHVYVVSSGGVPKTFPDGEFRAKGQYVVAPPSRHPEGENYRWLRPIDASSLASVDSEKSGLRRDWSEGSENSSIQGQQEDVIVPVFPEIPVLPVFPALPVYQGTDWTSKVDSLVVTGPQQHDLRTIDIARFAKFTQGISTGKEARHIFDYWWTKSRPNCSNQDTDDAWFHFLRAFRLALIPLGAKSHADAALAAVKDRPPPADALQFESERLRLLVAMMREMQRHYGRGNPFALSTHQIAKLLKATPRAAHNWLGGLQEVGLIVCKDRGTPGRPGRGAARFVYVADIS